MYGFKIYQLNKSESTLCNIVSSLNSPHMHEETNKIAALKFVGAAVECSMSELSQ